MKDLRGHLMKTQHATQAAEDQTSYPLTCFPRQKALATLPIRGHFLQKQTILGSSNRSISFARVLGLR